MPIGTIQQSEHTKYSTYQQQCNGSSLWGMQFMGNEDDNPTKTCRIQFLSPIYVC